MEEFENIPESVAELVLSLRFADGSNVGVACSFELITEFPLLLLLVSPLLPLELLLASAIEPLYKLKNVSKNFNME